MKDIHLSNLDSNLQPRATADETKQWCGKQYTWTVALLRIGLYYAFLVN
jgi:hypothetical protein